MAPKRIKHHNCQHCKATFSFASNLKRHIRTQHNQENREFVCDVCGKTFSRDDHMKSHRKLHFGGDGNILNTRPVSLNCDICRKTFKRPYHLKRHQRTQHRNGISESLECETCGTVFQRADHLKRHLKVHTKRPRTDMAKAGKLLVSFWSNNETTVIQYTAISINFQRQTILWLNILLLHSSFNLQTR